MEPSDPETVKMLTEARAKAEHLLSELLKQQAEVEANPPELTGRETRAGPVCDAEGDRFGAAGLKSLDEAQQIAATDMN